MNVCRRGESSSPLTITTLHPTAPYIQHTLHPTHPTSNTPYIQHPTYPPPRYHTTTLYHTLTKIPARVRPIYKKDPTRGADPEGQGLKGGLERLAAGAVRSWSGSQLEWLAKMGRRGGGYYERFRVPTIVDPSGSPILLELNSIDYL